MKKVLIIVFLIILLAAIFYSMWGRDLKKRKTHGTGWCGPYFSRKNMRLKQMETKITSAAIRAAE